MKKNRKNKIDELINFIGELSGFLIFALIVFIFISVVLRYFFAIGFTWLQDLYIWTHAIIILLGISYTLKQNEHVRIDLIYRNASDKYKKIINLFGLFVFGLPFCLILINFGFDYFLRSYILDESSKEIGGLPNLFILKFFILFMGITLLLQILNLILKIFSGKKW
tara:strand:+ start:64 stop:561 length:498 start_codon:yes stop_codon:yes gene_type:complete